MCCSLQDIFRRYPNQYESIIATLCDNLDSLDEPEAKVSHWGQATLARYQNCALRPCCRTFRTSIIPVCACVCDIHDCRPLWYGSLVSTRSELTTRTSC